MIGRVRVRSAFDRAAAVRVLQQDQPQLTAQGMKTPTTKGFPRGLLLLSLSAWPVGCFITYGGGHTRSTAQQLRPVVAGGVNRPLQQRLQPVRSRGALEAHQPSRAADASLVGSGGQRRLSETSRARSATGMTRLRQVT